MLWILSTLVWTVCMMSACLESSVECTSDGACAEGLVCVNTQCVDTEVVGDSYQVYKEEMHLRLVSQC